MIDREQFNYTMEKIKQNRGLYQIANEPLAEEMLPYIQQKMPRIRLVKCGIYQWFANDIKAINRLKKELHIIKSKKEKELEEINNTILQLMKMIC